MHVFPAIGVSSEVPEPYVISEVLEDEAEAATSGGHPAGGGAEEAVLDVDWVTVTSAVGGEAMELKDVAVISNSLVHLNLEKRISRQNR